MNRKELVNFAKGNKDTLLKILHQSKETGKEKGIAFCQIDEELSLQGEYIGKEWSISPSEIKCTTGKKIGEYHTHPEAEESPVAQGFSPADVLSALKEKKEMICLGFRKAGRDNIECLLFNQEVKDKAPYEKEKAIDQKVLLMQLTNRRQVEILNLMKDTKIPREFIGEYNLLTDILVDIYKEFIKLGDQIDYIQKEKIV